MVSPYAFKIGDTRKYGPYVRNGLARQLKTKRVMKFEPFEQCVLLNQ